MTLDDYEAQSAAWLHAQSNDEQDEAMDEALDEMAEEREMDRAEMLQEERESWFDAHFEDGDE